MLQWTKPEGWKPRRELLAALLFITSCSSSADAEPKPEPMADVQETIRVDDYQLITVVCHDGNKLYVLDGYRAGGITMIEGGCEE